MPPDLPNDQELTLKKRARRRLVGAVALVLLMVIVLPQILQDRAVLAQQEPIKITMPEVANHTPQPAVNNPGTETSLNTQLNESQADSAIPDVMPENSTLPDSDVREPITEHNAVKETLNKKTELIPATVVDKKVDTKAQEATKPEIVKSETTKSEIKTAAKQKESFTVQVGVYSDAANVKRLQEQLKQAGFSTQTEKVKTSKGESLRLKAGNFGSRQDANVALAKIKEIGLSGIVIGNE